LRKEDEGEMIGKMLKSKINGALFYVKELKNYNGKEYYIIVDVASGNEFTYSKVWFDNGLMQNLEIVSDHPTEKGR
jgi:hypothetical protein